MTDEISAAPLSDDERAVWRAALTLGEDLRALVTGELTPRTGLSQPDFLVLTRLQLAPEHRMAGMKALAAKLEWSPSRLSHHLKRMQTRGLVELAHEADGQLVVGATREAVRIMETATLQHARLVRQFLLSQVTEGERRVLLDVAERIRARRQGSPEQRD
ncbi:MarR family winged helix-turn-helix transcriptional regulator [Streptomyces olivoreticuli]|uniref:MarR family winged helix-turn-helix transcriptional regulator n=1 Tax=Streptomyces olivoreticuli TaxID=68246 RepID=UPI00265A6C1F|nr:MarR family winged helix-turn-helix transcriptional regulator [Streptomyces olivoreticuli]WKK24042.1 MarR family winged helix-turn-helix transcriptional regulator [Streptomyces olivoreticuli]